MNKPAAPTTKKRPPPPPPPKRGEDAPLSEYEKNLNKKNKPKLGFLKSTNKGESVTKTQLAKILGVTGTTIENWQKMGMKDLGKVKNSYRFDTAYVTRWRIELETNEIKAQFGVLHPESDKMTLDEARLRKATADALSAEVDLAVKREQVANIDDLMEAFGAALIEVKAKLVGMSARMSGELSHLDEDEVGELLDKDIEDILTVVSVYERS